MTPPRRVVNGRVYAYTACARCNYYDWILLPNRHNGKRTKLRGQARESLICNLCRDEEQRGNQ